MSEQITVLKDEALGGVEREYREVKRKAAVGDRIKATGKSGFEKYEIGDILTVTSAEPNFDFVQYDSNLSGLRDLTEYVVLEPVTTAASKLSANVTVTIPPEFSETLAGLVDTVAKLSVIAAELERKVERKYTKVLSGEVDDTLPSFARETLTRDEIVERAKADVAELRQTGIPFKVPRIAGGNQSFYPKDCDDVIFEVNRDKRKVVALIREKGGRVWARGIAAAAPGDVFNSHIGRAIALRRALGLEVPDEYINAPAPREVRVGDIVEITGNLEGHGEYRHYYDIGDIGRVGIVYDDDIGARVFGVKTKESRRSYDYVQEVRKCDVRVVDDSREEVGA